VISASHQQLAERVEAGRFRHDLFYRLNVIELKVPPLRDRLEDIPLLADYIASRLASAAGHPVPRLADGALEALRRYAFPGNVRELENILERAFALAEGDVVGAEDLNLTIEPAASGTGLAGWENTPLQDYLDQVEREAILKALEQTGGNKTAAARLLGVTFRSLRYRLDRLAID
jgi:two-component system response regulator PilR (NtrC family)